MSPDDCRKLSIIQTARKVPRLRGRKPVAIASSECTCPARPSLSPYSSNRERDVGGNAKCNFRPMGEISEKTATTCPAAPPNFAHWRKCVTAKYECRIKCSSEDAVARKRPSPRDKTQTWTFGKWPFYSSNSGCFKARSSTSEF